MKYKFLSIIAFFCLLFAGCIGEDVVEDFVDPELRIRNPVASLNSNEDYQYEARYLNNIGLPETADIVWSSSDDSVISINKDTGQVTANSAGEATITATFAADGLSATTTLRVIGEIETIEDEAEETDDGLEEPDEMTDEPSGGETEEPDGNVDEGTEDSVEPVEISRSGVIATTSSYALTGDFTMTSNQNGLLEIALGENYRASTSLPGLYVYLTNNPNSINGAFEVGKVTVFEGEHSYTLPADISITDHSYLMYWCKPFSVKVGGGDITE